MWSVEQKLWCQTEPTGGGGRVWDVFAACVCVVLRTYALSISNMWPGILEVLNSWSQTGHDQLDRLN